MDKSANDWLEAWNKHLSNPTREKGDGPSFRAGFAAAIREDRAEPVSESEVMAALSVVSREARIAMGRDFMRAALQAARQARANAAEKGGAR